MTDSHANIDAVYLLAVKDERVLLLVRENNSNRDFVLQLPGGRIHAGGDFCEALSEKVREVLPKITLQIGEVLPILFSGEDHFSQQEISVAVFFGSVLDSSNDISVVAGDICSACWVPLEDVASGMANTIPASAITQSVISYYIHSIDSKN